MSDEISELKVRKLMGCGYTAKEAVQYQIKLKRKSDEIVAGPSKKSIGVSSSYASIAKKWIVIIKHKEHPGNTLSDEQLSGLINSLHESLDRDNNAEIHISQTKVEFNQIIMECDDEASKQWIIKTTTVLDQTKILLIEDGDIIPKMKYVSIKHPDFKISANDVIKRLGKQNKGIVYKHWNVVETTTHTDGDRIIILQVDILRLRGRFFNYSIINAHAPHSGRDRKSVV